MQKNIAKSRYFNLLHNIYFRFFAAYFFVYVFPFPLSYLPFFKSIAAAYFRLLGRVILWIGQHVFGITVPHKLPFGVSDSQYDYVKLFVLLITALVITIVWSIAKRMRKYDEIILYWVSVYVRYRFVISMLKYGFEKIQKVQFPFPYDSLIETYGDSSPLRLMWNFMGYSTPYNIFIGTLEAGAGVLLLFRKTKLIGALVSIAVLSNIVMLNFCYDVPVKMHSFILLLMAVFLAAPDAKRLWLFFLQQAVPASGKPKAEYNKRWLTPAFSVLNFCIIMAVFYIKAGPIWRQYTAHDDRFRATPLFGLYNVETFVKNGDTLQPLITDTSQWRMLNIVYNRQATLKMMNDSMKVCNLVVDTAKRKIEIIDSNDSTYKASLFYTKPNSLHLALNGSIQKDSVYILLQKQNIHNYELLKRGFHWINEYPYKK